MLCTRSNRKPITIKSWTSSWGFGCQKLTWTGHIAYNTLYIHTTHTVCEYHKTNNRIRWISGWYSTDTNMYIRRLFWVVFFSVENWTLWPVWLAAFCLLILFRILSPTETNIMNFFVVFISFAVVDFYVDVIDLHFIVFFLFASKSVNKTQFWAFNIYVAYRTLHLIRILRNFSNCIWYVRRHTYKSITITITIKIPRGLDHSVICIFMNDNYDFDFIYSRVWQFGFIDFFDTRVSSAN